MKLTFNNKGYSTLMMVAILGGLMISGMVLYNYTLQTRLTDVGLKDKMTQSMLVNGVLEYVVQSVKSKWCINPTNWVQDKTGCTKNDFKHPGSVRRLLASDSELTTLGDNFIIQKQRGANFLTSSDLSDFASCASTSLDNLPQNQAAYGVWMVNWKNCLRLDSISGSIILNYDQLEQGHPVKALLDMNRGNFKPGYNKLGFVKAEILVKRSHEAEMPKYGREVNLDITVKFILENTNPNKQSTSIVMRSTIAATPAELNRYGLVVAGDLHLENQDIPGELKKGLFIANNLSLKKPPEVPPVGVHFESPVFINQRIILPPLDDVESSAEENDYAHYSGTIHPNVYFKDNVFLGYEKDQATSNALSSNSGDATGADGADESDNEDDDNSIVDLILDNFTNICSEEDGAGAICQDDQLYKSSKNNLLAYSKVHLKNHITQSKYDAGLDYIAGPNLGGLADGDPSLGGVIKMCALLNEGQTNIESTNENKLERLQLSAGTNIFYWNDNNGFAFETSNRFQSPQAFTPRGSMAQCYDNKNNSENFSKPMLYGWESKVGALKKIKRNGERVYEKVDLFEFKILRSNNSRVPVEDFFNNSSSSAGTPTVSLNNIVGIPTPNLFDNQGPELGFCPKDKDKSQYDALKDDFDERSRAFLNFEYYAEIGDPNQVIKELVGYISTSGSMPLQKEDETEPTIWVHDKISLPSWVNSNDEFAESFSMFTDREFGFHTVGKEIADDVKDILWLDDVGMPNSRPGIDLTSNRCAAFEGDPKDPSRHRTNSKATIQCSKALMGYNSILERNGDSVKLLKKLNLETEMFDGMTKFRVGGTCISRDSGETNCEYGDIDVPGIYNVGSKKSIRYQIGDVLAGEFKSRWKETDPPVTEFNIQSRYPPTSGTFYFLDDYESIAYLDKKGKEMYSYDYPQIINSSNTRIDSLTNPGVLVKNAVDGHYTGLVDPSLDSIEGRWRDADNNIKTIEANIIKAKEQMEDAEREYKKYDGLCRNFYYDPSSNTTGNFVTADMLEAAKNLYLQKEKALKDACKLIKDGCDNADSTNDLTKLLQITEYSPPNNVFTCDYNPAISPPNPQPFTNKCPVVKDVNKDYDDAKAQFELYTRLGVGDPKTGADYCRLARDYQRAWGKGQGLLGADVGLISVYNTVRAFEDRAKEFWEYEKLKNDFELIEAKVRPLQRRQKTLEAIAALYKKVNGHLKELIGDIKLVEVQPPNELKVKLRDSATPAATDFGEGIDPRAFMLEGGIPSPDNMFLYYYKSKIEAFDPTYKYALIPKGTCPNEINCRDYLRKKCYKGETILNEANEVEVLPGVIRAYIQGTNVNKDKCLEFTSLRHIEEREQSRIPTRLGKLKSVSLPEDFTNLYSLTIDPFAPNSANKIVEEGVLASDDSNFKSLKSASNIAHYGFYEFACRLISAYKNHITTNGSQTSLGASVEEESVMLATNGGFNDPAKINLSFLSQTNHSWYFAPIDLSKHFKDVAENGMTYIVDPANADQSTEILEIANNSIVELQDDNDEPDDNEVANLPTSSTAGNSNSRVSTLLSNSFQGDSFEVHSIASICTIKKNVTIFTGFLVCRNLIIEDGRTEPLEIIGTIIAGRVTIPQSAVDHGIFFKSIYHPDAKKYLVRDAPFCNQAIDENPVWYRPKFNTNDTGRTEKLSALEECSISHVRNKAQPFTWSKVDPDCGIAGKFVAQNGSNDGPKYDERMMCKDNVENYFITERWRTTHK